MAGLEDGWQTVMPTSQAGIERLSRPQVEAYERQILKTWETSDGHWSGIGKHTSPSDFAEAKKIHTRFKGAPHDGVLGTGSFGVVEKVHYTHQSRTVCIARKWIQPRRNRTIQILLEEANVMERLDHEHIVKLVGSYTRRQNELFLLIWPVAVCNLDVFCTDIDGLRTGQGDRGDILKRFAALDLRDVAPVERRRDQPDPAQAANNKGNCPLRYVQQIMGCITQAVAYCHNAHIRHLDLKPSNILLNPGRVYLADFGVARDVHGRDDTMAIGAQGTPKWRAPEIRDHDDEWSMNKADIYSLGLVLLSIAVVLYAPDMADFDDVLDDIIPQSRAAKLKAYHEKLRAYALASQDVQDAEAMTFGPRHILGLTSRMLASKPADRPRAEQVNADLVELGGIDQIYHSPCCRRSSRFVTDLMDKRYKVAVEGRAHLAEANEKMAKRLRVLEAKDETYEARIRNEQKNMADKIVKFREQMEKERRDRERLEEVLYDLMQQQNRNRRKPAHARHVPEPPERVASAGRRGGYVVAGAPPTGPSLMMRARPQTHPLQPAHANGTSSKPPPAIHAPQPITLHNTTATSIPMTRIPSSGYARPSLGPPTPTYASPSTNGGHPTQTPSPSPVPRDLAGYPLRSRGSGSRLPRAVNPSTPIRAGTPATLTRDPSLTDSTQFSLASSTFSRVSAAESAAATTGGLPGTPAVGSPLVDGRVKGAPAQAQAQAQAEDTDAAGGGGGGAATATTAFNHRDDNIAGGVGSGAGFGLGLGLGLGLDEALFAGVHTGVSGGGGTTTASDAASMRDTASVRSSTAAGIGPGTAGTMSPVLGGSALSSPRTAKAELLGSSSSAPRVPSLPSAKSWADVARREKR